jgi:hypothetical protein
MATVTELGRRLQREGFGWAFGVSSGERRVEDAVEQCAILG